MKKTRFSEGNCSPGWRVVPWSGGSEAAVDEVTDGAGGGPAVQAGGPGDRAVAGVDAGTPAQIERDRQRQQERQRGLDGPEMDFGR